MDNSPPVNDALQLPPPPGHPPFWDDDRLSWEDSERFEEDSLCSWLSEPESLCQNWRGWSARGPAGTGNTLPASLSYTGGIPSTSSVDACVNTVRPNGSEKTSVLSLVDLAARTVSKHKSFEEVEQFSFLRLGTSAPEALQLRIAYWCFPSSEDDIRLYSCLANGNADEFQRGENLYKSKSIKDLLQIGFHLSAVVTPPPLPIRSSSSLTRLSVAVTVDRCRIISCFCTCNQSASWCSHVVAVCLQRIHQPECVRFRAPVSESLNHLREQQLRKFAQYLISELPREILPTAQRLLDQLLSPQSHMNAIDGAPDPTAGASKEDVATWCLDEQKLHDNIKKILIKFCVPSPTVFSDVNYLSSNQPPVANEWQSLLRPLRGREPEGLWNLLSIVREMYRRHDTNATSLLHIITDQCLNCDQVVMWWYQTKLFQSGNWAVTPVHGSKSGLASSQHNAQYSCASLCDEVVSLWRLAALDPGLHPNERKKFSKHLRLYHRRVVEKIWKILAANNNQPEVANNNGNNNNNTATISGVVASYGKLTVETARFDLDSFPGFKTALEACLLDWNDHQIDGVTCRTSLIPKNTCLTENSELSVICGSDPLSPGQTRSPYSPSLPILREKHFKSVLKTSSSSETIIAQPSSSKAQQISPQIKQEPGSPESGQESDGLECSPATACSQRFEFRGQCSVESALSADGRSTPSLDEQPGPSGLNRSQNDEQLDEIAQIYMPRPPANDQPEASGARPKQLPKCPSAEVEDILSCIAPASERLDISFCRCEALYAHGFGQQACQLAVQLAYELIENPPNLMVDLPPGIPATGSQTPTKSGRSGDKRRKKINIEVPLLAHPKAVQLSRLASATLQRAIFLLEVLLKERPYHHLAFCVGLFALELPRHPASTKFLEVKMNHQESEIMALLKRIELQNEEMEMLREKAQKLRSGYYAIKPFSPVLPFSLTHHLFEALSCSPPNKRLPGDEQLGFEAAIAALGMKSTVSEAEHSLLCEGIRRQRGELALALLIRCKDQQDKVTLIMDRLLDSDMHLMYRHYPSNAAFYIHGRAAPPGSISSLGMAFPGQSHDSRIRPGVLGNIGTGVIPLQRSLSGISQGSVGLDELVGTESDSPHAEDAEVSELSSRMDEQAFLGDIREDPSSSSPCLPERLILRRSTDEGTDSRVASREQSPKSYCLPSDAASDTSSSSTSRKLRLKGDVAAAASSPTSQDGGLYPSTNNYPSNLLPGSSPPTVVCPSSIQTAGSSKQSDSFGKGCHYKMSRHRKHVTPCVPNQASEAHAHYMMELAKRLLTEAGGNHSTAIFNAPQNGAPANQQHGPHRALHLCALQIGLYALGLHNKVTPNWLSRTYSSHVSWISGQAVEIGRIAIRILIDTWENHLTPTEVANLADKASQGREPGMVLAASELALSALPHAHALNPTEIQRALAQCREQNNAMLERACLAVEQAAKDGGVYPEVLFMVAKRWYDLYNDLESNTHELPIQPQPQMYQQMQQPVPQNNLQQAQLQQQMMSPAVMMELNAASGAPILMPPSSMAQGPLPVMPMFQMPTTMPGPFPPMSAAPNAASSMLPPGFPAHAANMYNPYMNNGTLPPGIYTNQMRPMYFPQQQILAGYCMPGGPPRALHVSHSAPNLAPQPHQHGLRHRHHHHHHPQNPMPLAGNNGVIMGQQQQQMAENERNQSDVKMRYLYASYRVGMLAMETMGRRIHDDRSYIKYSQNPPYGDDVRWLFKLSQQLGIFYVQHFCLVAAQSVVSPFVLWDLWTEAARIFPAPTCGPIMPPHAMMQLPPTTTTVTCYSQGTSGNNAATARLQAAINNVGVSTPATHLLQRCLHMFYAAANQKLSHPRFMPSDAEEVCNLVRAAKIAFHQLPETGPMSTHVNVHLTGSMLFNDFIQNLRRQKACKKDVWTKVLSAANGS